MKNIKISCKNTKKREKIRVIHRIINRLCITCSKNNLSTSIHNDIKRLHASTCSWLTNLKKDTERKSMDSEKEWVLLLEEMFLREEDKKEEKNWQHKGR